MANKLQSATKVDDDNNYLWFCVACWEGLEFKIFNFIQFFLVIVDNNLTR